MKYLAKNIAFLREKKNLTQAAIAVQLGFSRTTWNNYENGVSTPVLDDFIKLSKFFGVGESELLHIDISKKHDFSKKVTSGKKRISNDYSGDYSGDFSTKKLSFEEEKPAQIMHIKMPQVITVDSQGNENVVMVPVRARAGYLNGYADPKFIEELPAYRLPGLNNGTFRLFEVEGNSMYNTLYSGDLVIGSFVEQLRDVRDDRVHVIVTKNDGIVIKRCLNRIQKDGKLILKSDNYKERDLYPPIICDPLDVIEIWYAIGFISRQMRPPAEIYTRIIDLEGRLTLMEDKYKKNPK